MVEHAGWIVKHYGIMDPREEGADSIFRDETMGGTGNAGSWGHPAE